MIYILKGLCSALERYKKFCEFQKEILKFNKENKELKIQSIPHEFLKKEEEILRDKRRIFELKLNDEIKRFGSLYDKELIEILKKYAIFLKNSTNEEFEILNQFEFR